MSEAAKMNDEQFVRELDVFRSEIDTGVRFFYSQLAIQIVAGGSEAVREFLNQAPGFWKTNLAGLQAGTFVTLGRLFDQTSAHNLDRVLRAAQEGEVELFSRDALRCRKAAGHPTPPPWLDSYIQGAYEPSPRDFRRLRKHVDKWRKVYLKRYADLRRKLFAHREVGGRAEIDVLFNKTSIGEMQRMFAFLDALHRALWELYNNGRKPVLVLKRYSAKAILARPAAGRRGESIQERVVLEVRRFLVDQAAVRPPGARLGVAD